MSAEDPQGPAVPPTRWACKLLSANDVGATGSHQSGILIPKNSPLLEVFPPPDPNEANPSCVFVARSPLLGEEWHVRLVFYNVAKNEYRLTGVTGMLRALGAQDGDVLCFAAGSADDVVLVSIGTETPDMLVAPPSGSPSTAEAVRPFESSQTGGTMSYAPDDPFVENDPDDAPDDPFVENDPDDAPDDAFVENDPDVARIVDALADTGYSFNSAVADIVDNSISHGEAAVISIHLGLNTADKVEFWIADDGCGMDRDDLVIAMRYGAPKRKDAHSLGKFGVGLKTASTSFARRLIVLTRPEDAAAPLNMAAWDLDKIGETRKWLLEVRDADAAQRDLFDNEREGMVDCGGHEGRCGTLVKWEKTHHILMTTAGTPAVNVQLVLKRVAKSLKAHLAMVFHRFLDPADSRARTVKIIVNGEEFEAWDPFLTSRGIKPEADFEFDAVEPKSLPQPKIRVVILPNKGMWEEAGYTLDDEKYAAVGLENQGIYLYRESRMLQAARWMGAGARETHLNALRVELDFTEELDDVFSLDMKKSQVNPSPEFTAELKKAMARFRREADRRQRKKASEAAAGAGRGGPTEAAITRLGGTLKVSTGGVGDDGSIVLTNNTGFHTVVDAAGAVVSDMVRIVPSTPLDKGLNIVRVESLPNAVLWEATMGDNGSTQVRLNVSHPWYVKAYVPNAENSALAQAIDFILFALGQAELNNMDDALKEVFEEFRVEVSRNLNRLVSHLVV